MKTAGRQKLIYQIQQTRNLFELCNSVNNDCSLCPFPRLYPSMIVNGKITCTVSRLPVKVVKKFKPTDLSQVKAVYEFFIKNTGFYYGSGEIAKALNIDHSIASRSVMRLSEKGLIQRTIDKTRSTNNKSIYFYYYEED